VDEKSEQPGKSRRVHRLLLWTILVLALALRLAYVSGLSPGAVFASADARGYRLLAMNLLDHGCFSPPGNSPSLLAATRMPLYPAMLALALSTTDDASLAVPVAQSVLDVVVAALVYGLVSRLTDHRRGLLAAFLYAINPISFLFVGQALTEVVLAFLMTLTFYVFVIALEAHQRRYSLLAVTGFLSALCILCKPNVVLLPLILAVSLICHCRCLSWRTLKEASILWGVGLAVLVPWLVRNHLVYGEWFLSLAFDDNLAHVSAVATILEARGEQVAPWTPRWEETYMSEIVAPASTTYGWAERDDSSKPPEAVRRQREMAAIARSLLRQHPSAFVVSHLKGVLRSFVPSLHRYWYAYVTKTPWPESEALQTVLSQAWRRIRNGEWSGGLKVIGQWWWRHPPLARGLWLASAILHSLGGALLIAGIWCLRTRPGVLVGSSLILLYLALLPGPIAHIRFWMPGVPLAIGLMGAAFFRYGRAKPVLSR
jgi:4-amino-4-deoxy-L-arabinose transferase-like glycosyltransferase